MTDHWKGKTAYPRDVATKRHVDRVQDRLDRRVDLHGEKVQRLKIQLIELRRDHHDLRVVVEAIFQTLEGKNKE